MQHRIRFSVTYDVIFLLRIHGANQERVFIPRLKADLRPLGPESGLTRLPPVYSVAMSGGRLCT